MRDKRAVRCGKSEQAFAWRALVEVLFNIFFQFQLLTVLFGQWGLPLLVGCAKFGNSGYHLLLKHYQTIVLTMSSTTYAAPIIILCKEEVVL